MKRKGVLLIHGFAGTREELLPLYNTLHDEGYSVIMPVLTGHEGTYKQLATSKYTQWIESAETAYLKLAEACDDIMVIGFSMGGLIAVNLFQKHHFNKLVTINTPVYYWDIKRMFHNLCDDFITYFKKYFVASTNKPFQSLVEFQKLLSKTKPLINTVSCDTLIIQTQDDDTVNINSAKYIYNHISGNKRLIHPKYGGHIVFRSDDYAEIIMSIRNFISSVF